MSGSPDTFSPDERDVLALWTAALPPADFADRVLAQAVRTVELGPSTRRARRGWTALAAAAAVLLGLWSGRGAIERGLVAPPGGSDYQRSLLINPDGGPQPEAAEAHPAVDSDDVRVGVGAEAKTS